MEPITRFSGAYRFLSNFYPADVRLGPPVEPDGAVYSSVEHAFQAAKTTDISWRVKIWGTTEASVAKVLGRKAPLRPFWDKLRVDVMRNLLRQKFAPGALLAAQLHATADALLVEGNTWHDNFWGSCTCQLCDNRGENKLGELLMQVRKELR